MNELIEHNLLLKTFFLLKPTLLLIGLLII